MLAFFYSMKETKLDQEINHGKLIDFKFLFILTINDNDFPFK